MEDKASTEHMILNLSSYQDLIKVLNSYLEKLYEVFYLLYKDYNINTRFDSKSRKYYLFIVSLLWYNLQLITLTFPAETLKISDNYPGFSAAIQSTRFDYLSLVFDFRLVFYYITVFCILLPFCGITLAFVKLIKGNKIKGGNYRYVISTPLSIINSGFYPSFLCVHLASAQDAFSSSDSFYKNQGIQVSSSESTYTGPLSAFLLPILYFLVYLEVVFNYEQFPTRMNSKLTSRPCAKFELMRLKLVTGICCLYVLVGESYYNIYLVICAIAGFMFSYLFLYYLPFYHKLLNFGYCFAFAGLGMGGISHLAAVGLNEGGIVLNAILMVLPAVGVILYDLMGRREKYIRNNYKNNFGALTNLSLCELGIRFEMLDLIEAQKNKDKESAAEIKSVLESMFCIMNQRFSNVNILYIWEFVYSYNVLKEENLSRIKLSHALDGDFDIEYSYLYYKYIKLLRHFSFNYSEEVDYSNFLIMLHDAKKVDRETCYSQLEFWSELSKPFPNVKKLEQLGYKLYKDIYINYKKCRQIHKKYPDNSQASKLYGTFLSDVFNDSELGHKVLSKVDQNYNETAQKRVQRGHLSYFDLNHGCMIVSGNPDLRGCIQYLNKEAAEMFDEPMAMCMNNHVCNYCPVPMNNKSYYDRTLVVYLQSRKYTTIPIPSLTYMIDSNRFLFELFLKVHCVAIDSYPFFLAIMSKVNRPRGCALLSSDLIIENHTKEFPIIIGFSEESTQMAGIHIKEIIDNFDEVIESVENNTVIQYLNPLTFVMVYLRLDIFYIKLVSFRALYITTLKSEAMRWDELKSQRNDYVEETAEYVELKLRKDRILKPPNRSIMRNRQLTYKQIALSVTFAPHPYLYELDHTDFAPGKTSCILFKDAHVILSRKNSAIQHLDTDIIATTTNTILSPKGKFQVSFEDEIQLEAMIPSIAKETPNRTNSVLSSASSYSFTTSNHAKNLINTLNNSVRSFKVSYFISLLAVTFSVLVIIIYIFTTSNSFQSSIAALQLSGIRTQTMMSAEYARITQLLDYNSYFQTPDEESLFKSTYQNLTKSYEDILEEINSKSKDWKSSTREYFYDKKVTAWYKSDNTIYTSEIKLVDSMKMIIKSSYDLLSKDEAAIDIHDPSLYFAFRNGHSETLHVLNETVVECMDEARETLQEVVTVVQVLCSVALGVLLICFFAIILPAILKVEKSNQNIWNFYFNLTNETLTEIRGNIEDRLSNIHDEKISDSLHEFGKFTVKSRKNIKSRRKWVNMMVKLLISYTISLCFLGFFYYWITAKYIELLHFKVQLSNWSGMRSLALHSTFFWYSEMTFDQTDYRYFDIISQDQSLTTLEQELNKSLELLEYSDFLLAHSYLSDVGLDNTHFDILFKDASSLVPDSLYLSKGVHSILIDFRHSILTYPKNMEMCNQIRQLKDDLSTVLLDLEVRYDKHIETEIDDSEFMLLWITGTYIVLMFLFYLILYIPSINNIKQQVTRIWDISRLIPIDLLEMKHREYLN